MDIYVVDTNIVFSAAMHPSRSIGRFFLLAKKYGVKFYAPEFLQEEIERHFPKLVELTKLPPNTVRE